MNNRITISVENTNGELDSLVSQLGNYCENHKKVKSCTGLEIATFIMTVGQLIAALAALPMLTDALNNKHITVKFGGTTLGYTVDEVLSTLRNNSDFLEAAKKAINENTFEISGKGKVVDEFWKKLKEYTDIGVG